jgi:subtilisin family serine protease
MVADGGVCLVIGRVFPNSGGSATSSSILSAIQWAVEVQGAKVVSMSLGGPGYSTTEDRFYQNLLSSGVIVVAAAGNSGSSQMLYPASYSTVISVAAVDSNRNRAPFSQYNSQVDLSAPGVGILSTVPTMLGGLSTLSVPGRGAVLLKKMAYSVNPSFGGVSGPLANCGQGTGPCPGGSGQVCLIERFVQQR